MRLLAIVLVLALAPLGTLDAADDAGASRTGSAGMRAYRDPATGALIERPVTAEQKRIAEQPIGDFNKSSAGLVIVRLPDGSEMVDLQGRFQHAMRALRNETGTQVLSCGDSAWLPDLRGVVLKARAEGAGDAR
jgi:hypothetical protein